MLAQKNLVLQALPPAMFQAAKAKSKLVFLRKGDNLVGAAHRRKVYFPVTCVIAMYARSEMAPETFLCLVGANGCAGLSERLSAPGLWYSARVCGGGYALSMDREHFMDICLSRKDEMQLRLLSTGIVAQLGLLNAACASTHSSAQRIARMLLEAFTVWPNETPLELGHMDLAGYISVRRETVSKIIKEIENKKIIENRREKIHVRNRQGLQDRACDCAQTYIELMADWHRRWQAIHQKEAAQMQISGDAISHERLKIGGGGNSDY